MWLLTVYVDNCLHEIGIRMISISTRHVGYLIPGGPGLSPKSIADLERLCTDDLFDSLSTFWPPGAGNRSELPFSKDISHEGNFRTVIDYAIEELKARLGNAQFSFIGHSFGGKIAIDLARVLPARAKAVVVIAAPFTSRLEKTLIDSIERLASENFRKARHIYHRRPTRQTYRAFSSHYADWCSLQGNTKEKIRDVLANDESSSLATVMWNKRQAWDETLEQDIRNLSCKKVGIFGTDDQLVDIHRAEAECKRLGFQFFRIDGAGHFPFLENPFAVRKALKEALLDKSCGS